MAARCSWRRGSADGVLLRFCSGVSGDRGSGARYGRPSDRFSLTDGLVPQGEAGDLEVKVTPQRGHRLLPAKLRRYMDSRNPNDVISFPGVEFDDVVATLMLDGVQRRVVLDAGVIPARLEISPTLKAGEPDRDSLFSELRRTLDVVT